MTKLELIVSSQTYECTFLCKKASSLLGAENGVKLQSLLSDDSEFQDLEKYVQELLVEAQDNECAFRTFNIVFRAPNAPSDAPGADRSPVGGVFRSPIRAIHLSGELELSCFAHIEFSANVDGSKNFQSFRLTAIEYSRQHRENLIRQEFGSWLLEEHIEKSVIATDPIGTIVFFNRFAETLYQFTREEAIGASIMDIVPSEMTVDQAQEIFGRLVKGEHWSGFFRVKRKDSSDIMAHVTDTPVLSKDGELKFVVGVSADYSEMHNLMEKLKTLNANLEDEVCTRTRELLEREHTLRMVGAAVKESDTGVIITNEEFKIEWSNDAVYKLLNRAENEVLNSLPWDLPLDYELVSAPGKRDSPGEHQALECAKDFYLSNKQTPINAHVISTASDHQDTVYVSVAVQAMSNMKHRMIILRDRTAERKAEEAHSKAEKEAAASQTKTEMIQMLSHEFRTPLQGIMGVVSTMLVDLKENSSLYDSLVAIIASSRLLLTLINNVLDLGKMDANKLQTVELSNLPLLSCIQDSISFCEHFAKINEVRLTFDRATTNRTIIGNRLRLEQIMINLLSNAIKYAGSGTEVNISVRTCHVSTAVTDALNAGTCDLKGLPREEVEAYMSRHNNVTVVSIRDQGQGIPQDEMGTLFGEFVQLRVSQELDRNHGSGGKHVAGQSSGSGLGLNLVLKFVQIMNGHIWVNNCESGGAEFSFCLPESEVSVSEAECPQSSRPVPAQFLNNKSLHVESFSVLVVDDSKINLKVLQRMLKRLGIHKVAICSDGGEALNYLNSVEDAALLPNLILSDLNMPNMNGFTLVSHLQKLTRFPVPPIVMACTADWTCETEQRCLDAGFDGVLKKPIVLPVLKEFLTTVSKTDSVKLPFYDGSISKDPDCIDEFSRRRSLCDTLQHIIKIS